jgi:hypothetical protein
MNTQEFAQAVKSLRAIDQQLKKDNCDPNAARRDLVPIINKLDAHVQADLAASQAKRKRYYAQPTIDGTRRSRFAKPAIQGRAKH